MSYTDQLAQNKKSIDSLKTAVSDESIANVLNSLKENWNPKTKVCKDVIRHGSHKDDEIEYLLYWDEAKFMWTCKEFAFKSYVLKMVSNAIVLQYPALFNEL